MNLTRDPEYRPPALNPLGSLGRKTLLTCRNTGRGVLMLFEAVVYIRTAFSARARREILYQMFFTGIKSLGVITVVALFTGMILALQTGLALRDFGQEATIGAAVMLSMLREMGPFMTALILAASVGSSIAAQLGTMVVAEEIAALEVMSINPIRLLVMPRLVALSVMTVLLTFYTAIVGVAGGAIVGYTQLGVSIPAYIDSATRFADNKDLYVGLFKAFLFGVLITMIACHQGFSTKEGAVGVGRATRRSVVISFLTILVVGYIITRLFYS